MRRMAVLLGLIVLGSASTAKDPPLLNAEEAKAIAAQLSGGAAKRTVENLSLNHRMRGSSGYRRAAKHIRSRLEEFGLAEADIIALPADGKIFYGTQRSRPAWDAQFAELWERKLDVGRWVDAERVASWDDQPITLAQDSASGTADAELVDVGGGTAESDYAERTFAESWS